MLASLGSSLESFFDAVGSFFDSLASIHWGPLLLGLLCFTVYLTLRARASFNILRAAYPDEHFEFRRIWGAYVAAYGFNGVIPARGGDVIRLFLTKTSVPRSSYPAVGVGDGRRERLRPHDGGVHPHVRVHAGRVPQAAGLLGDPGVRPAVLRLAPALHAVPAHRAGGRRRSWRSRCSRRACRRSGRGCGRASPSSFDRRRYFREVWLVQFAGWLFRFTAFWFLLEAFNVGGSVRNVLLVLGVNAVAALVPFTPGRRGGAAGAARQGLRGDRDGGDRGGLLGGPADRDRRVDAGDRLRRAVVHLPLPLVQGGDRRGRVRTGTKRRSAGRPRNMWAIPESPRMSPVAARDLLTLPAAAGLRLRGAGRAGRCLRSARGAVVLASAGRRCSSALSPAADGRARGRAAAAHPAGRADRAGQPPPAPAAPDLRDRAPPAPRAALHRARARPRRLQGRQRPLRPPGRRRGAARDRVGARARGARPGHARAPGRRRVLRARARDRVRGRRADGRAPALRGARTRSRASTGSTSASATRCSPTRGATPEELLERADAAAIDAKRHVARGAARRRARPERLSAGPRAPRARG